MDGDLLAMRKASQRKSKTRCAACELVDEMTEDHVKVFHDSYRTSGINSAGRRWWVREHYPEARLLTLKSPEQCLRIHQGHIDE